MPLPDTVLWGGYFLFSKIIRDSRRRSFSSDLRAIGSGSSRLTPGKPRAPIPGPWVERNYDARCPVRGTARYGCFQCSVKSEGEGSAQPGRSGPNASAAASIVDVICQRRVRRTGTRAEKRSGPGTNILRRFVCSAEVRKSILESCSRLLLATVAFLLGHLARCLRL